MKAIVICVDDVSEMPEGVEFLSKGVTRITLNDFDASRVLMQLNSRVVGYAQGLLVNSDLAESIRCRTGNTHETIGFDGMLYLCRCGQSFSWPASLGPLSIAQPEAASLGNGLGNIEAGE